MSGFKRIATLSLAAGLSTAAQAQITTVGTYIQQNFFQSDSGVSSWSSGRPAWMQELDASVGGNAKITFSLGTVTQAQGLGATVTLLGASSPSPLSYSTDWNDVAYHFDYTSGGYASLAQLLAANPDGAYTFHAPAIGSSGQTATLNFHGSWLTNTAMASTVPMLTNYASLQGMNASSAFTFNFNAFNGYGGSSNPLEIHPFSQISIFDLSSKTGVYTSPYISSSSTSFVLGANTLQSGHDYAYVVFQDSFACSNRGPLCGNLELASSTFGTFSTAAGPATAPTLVDFQGGTAEAPVELPRVINQIGAVSGSIGGAPDVDFYKFVWTGGRFSATATLTGAAADAEFVFKLINFSTGQVVDRLTLDQLSNSFSGTLSAELAAGVYIVGLVSGATTDPAFTISFDTSGMAAPIPEPDARWLMAFGLVALVLRRRSALRAR